MLPDEPCGIRWPNDVFIGRDADRKIAGILVEVPTAARPRIVIGLGLNVNNSLRADTRLDVRQRATSHVDLAGRAGDLCDVLIQLLRHIDGATATLMRHDRTLPHAWQSRCLLRGRQVALALGPRTELGCVVEVGEDAGCPWSSKPPPARSVFFGGVLTVIE